MQIGQDGVPLGSGARGRIGNRLDGAIGAVYHLKAAGFGDPADADEFADVVRLRIDSHLAFRGIEALVVDGPADGNDVVAAGRRHRLSPEMYTDVSALHRVGEDAFGSKTSAEACDKILVLR